MIKNAIRSLKHDISRAFFYWLVFFITSFFIFTFFNLAYSPSFGFEIGKNDTTFMTLVAVVIALVCICVVFFANDFYVKKKSKEIAIDLVCGATYGQLVIFLLVQTGIIFIAAIPLGILFGYLVMPLIEVFMSLFLQSQIQVVLFPQAIIITLTLLAFEIFWCTILNLGYSFRSSIRSLVQSQTIQIEMYGLSSIKIKFHWIVYVILYILPIIGIYCNADEPTGLLIFSIVGIFGIYNMILNVIIPYLEKRKRKIYIRDSQELVYKGLIKDDLNKLKGIIALLVLSSILFITLLGIVIEDPIQTLLVILCYVVAVLLSSLSILFKFSSEMDSREQIFYSLYKIGYLTSDLKAIKRKEIIGLYSIIFVLSLSYIVSILLALYFHHFIQLNLVMLLISLFICIVAICGCINLIHYQRHS